MTDSGIPQPVPAHPLPQAVALDERKILKPDLRAEFDRLTAETPVLVILAAGKGTRFGRDPKCIQPVDGVPLARRSIDAFKHFRPSPAICIVGYRHEEVSAALGGDNLYVRSDNPTGGTAFAAYEVFCVSALEKKNPLLIVTMGDRIVPSSIFRRLWQTHNAGTHEADLTFLTAQYEPPKNRGKGRVLRDANGRVLRIMEERDIVAQAPSPTRDALLNLTEGNCPLYSIRAATLLKYLRNVTNANAQGQYYLTDVIEAVSRDGGDIRTLTTRVSDPEYDLLCSDVTQAQDLALLEGILATKGHLLFAEELAIEKAAQAIATDRPAGQVASIARQLGELASMVEREALGFDPDRPVGIGISGGRLRIAFMHPDMARFFGPAWQMPIGAGDAEGQEQIVMLVQGAADRRIHLFPSASKYRENVNYVPSDDDVMYPGLDVSDLHAYEQFGTRMSETLLLSLGYFSNEELERRREKGLPLPPASLWVASNMRRPFALVGNAIASMRTLRTGSVGAKVQAYLGRTQFRGLRLVSTGDIPQGGFSSSSAVTVATKNAINALFDIGIPPDLLVHLACQAEYGTGVRAGSLDQATEQKGRANRGTLISSNPRDNYRILGTYPVPTDRFQIIFPYSVDRDRDAWRWSWGAYAESPGTGPLTTGETRKMTGKAAEIAALLTQLPLNTDFFKRIENDLVGNGRLSLENRAWICSILRQLPLLIRQDDLRARLSDNRDWYIGQLQDVEGLDARAASRKADAALASLLTGWRDPVKRRSTASRTSVDETGLPLRAIVAYLFGEVAKCFHLVHHPDQWIEYVTWSQLGDRCVDLVPDRLPSRAAMEAEFDWERHWDGPQRMNLWLERHEATPCDYNRGLDDESLSADSPPDFRHLPGANFFRGLALVDLAEAMLKRAFGEEGVAVRVNAAGQGDYFQVHVDTQKAGIDEVKQFLRRAFYRRFELSPVPEFVELHSGGGATGVRLDRYDALAQLIQRLETVDAKP